jgi:hypothetical protein
MICWKKDGDPLKAWNNKMTRGGNKTHYVWVPFPITLSPCHSTKGKSADTERPSKGSYLDGYESTKYIDLPPP